MLPCWTVCLLPEACHQSEPATLPTQNPAHPLHRIDPQHEHPVSTILSLAMEEELRLAQLKLVGVQKLIDSEGSTLQRPF